MEEIYQRLVQIREQSPLVHNITNFVVMNNTANALLAIGASPVMAHAVEEVEDMVEIASALVINIGTLSPAWVSAMKMAMVRAQSLQKPIILDPVGAGATPYRNQTLLELLRIARPTVIRGNASEIMAMADTTRRTKGVDSTESSQHAVEAGKYLCEITEGSIICISGVTDYIITPHTVYAVENGHPLMAQITGMGCTATALIGAFCGATSTDSYDIATLSAMITMGVCGEMAAENSSGPGSMQVNILDALYQIGEKELAQKIRFSTSTR